VTVKGLKKDKVKFVQTLKIDDHGVPTKLQGVFITIVSSIYMLS
jgi:hypothetical protein